ncbi:hypothetical protein SOPP22_14995 [Shewanella sp. OPT22]|nr:hypothetical protein SOPP22_14995 [Shewanella sp. OPT22]
MNYNWKQLLTSGNRYFYAQQLHEAEECYLKSFNELSMLYRQNPKCADTLMAWICNCHNLSTLYERQHKMAQSFEYLKIPHDYLTKLYHCDESNTTRLIVIKALNLTWQSIVNFKNSHPEVSISHPQNVN